MASFAGKCAPRVARTLFFTFIRVCDHRLSVTLAQVISLQKRHKPGSGLQLRQREDVSVVE